jgi:WD40 repeat protein
MIPELSGTRTMLVGSKCHDLVVIDAVGSLVSGHYDKQIRMWDSYTDKCRQVLSFDAPITSLSFNAGKPMKRPDSFPTEDDMLLLF